MIRNATNAVRGALVLMTRLPGMLRVMWFMLLAGMILIVCGYFTRESWQTWGGVTLLLGTYLAMIAHAAGGRRHRDQAAEFYVAVVKATFVGAFMFLLMVLTGAAFFAVWSIWNGFSWAHVGRVPHLIGMYAAVFTVLAVPIAFAARRAER